MEENKRSSSSSLLSGFLGFILGAVFGLVVLGWWLWPVKWEDSRDNQLMPASQQDYLRAAIDSYSHNLDKSLARQRYLNLGDDADLVLNEIWKAPDGTPPQEIKAYAVVVGAALPPIDQAAVSTAASPTQSMTKPASGAQFRWFANRPLWIAFALILFMAFLVFLILIIIGVARSASRARKNKSAPIVQTFDTPDQTFESQASPEMDTAEPGEIPDWLKPAPDQEITASQPLPGESESAELSDEDFTELSQPDAAPIQNEIEQIIEQPAPPSDLEWTEAEQNLSTQVEEGTQLENEEEMESEAILAESQSEAGDEVNISIAVGEETPEQTYAKFSLDVHTLPDIEPEEAGLMNDAGYPALLLLFRAGASPEGRLQIAEKTGLEPDLILGWINAIDLLRVKGLKNDHLPILKSVGVDRIVQLAAEDPTSLYQKMIDLGPDAPTAIPSKPEVVSWVEQARQLPQIIQTE